MNTSHFTNKESLAGSKKYDLKLCDLRKREKFKFIAPWHWPKLDETFSLPLGTKFLIYRVNSVGGITLRKGNDNLGISKNWGGYYVFWVSYPYAKQLFSFQLLDMYLHFINSPLILSSLAVLDCYLKSQVFLLKQSISLNIFCQASLGWWPRNKCNKRKRNFARWAKGRKVRH